MLFEQIGPVADLKIIIKKTLEFADMMEWEECQIETKVK